MVTNIPSDYLYAGVSQVCYSQSGCAGDIAFTAPGPSARDCCAKTDDGQSYSDVNGDCIVPQCIGMYSNAYCGGSMLMAARLKK